MIPTNNKSRVEIAHVLLLSLKISLHPNFINHEVGFGKYITNTYLTHLKKSDDQF